MLRVESLQAWYGHTQALFNASFDIAEGETLALVGANGAGKTTVVRAIAGLIRAKGFIFMDGDRLDSVKAHRRARDFGLAVVHEGRGLFPQMTVRENLIIGLTRSFTPSLDELFGLFPMLAERLHDRVSDLSGGQQQMVALGRAILRKPRLLLLDEPSLGLAPVAITEVYEFLGILRKSGMSMLLVEQSIPLACSSADRLCLLQTGSTKMTADPTDDTAVKRLIAAAFEETAQRADDDQRPAR